jgi:hypothetical protein
MPEHAGCNVFTSGVAAVCSQPVSLHPSIRLIGKAAPVIHTVFPRRMKPHAAVFSDRTGRGESVAHHSPADDCSMRFHSTWENGEHLDRFDGGVFDTLTGTLYLTLQEADTLQESGNVPLILAYTFDGEVAAHRRQLSLTVSSGLHAVSIRRERMHVSFSLGQPQTVTVSLGRMLHRSYCRYTAAHGLHTASIPIN